MAWPHFSKMHGIGNDFVIIDARDQPLSLRAEQICQIGDRRRGVGFDQLLTIERSSDADCAWAYGIWNTDGSKAGQCGNGVRCVAAWLARDGSLGSGTERLMSPSGAVEVQLLDNGQVRVDMGVPKFDPAAIPLLTDERHDPCQAEISGRSIRFDAVSMGNPHAVIEVPDVDDADVASIGPALEHSPRFPERCNVGFVQLQARDHLRLRVWERGVGETQACGTGACAAVACLQRSGRVDNHVAVDLPGGRLLIDWAGPGQRVLMTGPATFVFDGEWHDDAKPR